jgi:DNA-binding XRE family transcriptional regulator
MKKEKRKRLERAGWKVGDTKGFLDLDDAEMAVIELRVSLARKLRERRRAQKISQETFAKRIGSSQSRVARMEAGDPSVSIDLLIRALLIAGSTKKEIGRVIANAAAAA